MYVFNPSLLISLVKNIVMLLTYLLTVIVCTLLTCFQRTTVITCFPAAPEQPWCTKEGAQWYYFKYYVNSVSINSVQRKMRLSPQYWLWGQQTDIKNARKKHTRTEKRTGRELRRKIETQWNFKWDLNTLNHSHLFMVPVGNYRRFCPKK